jgi:branched-subunit amino acid ABC-type transport system permease component
MTSGLLAAVDAQTIVNAVGLGAVFALMAVGIGLVFGVLRLVNFAYGQLVMVGAYTLAFTAGWPVAASIAACFVVVVTLSMVMERVVFRPLRGESPAVMLVTTFAIAFVLQAAALLVDIRDDTIGEIATSIASFNQPISVGGVDVALRETIVVLVGVVVGGIDRLWTATLGGFAIGFTTGVINGVLPTEKTVYLPSAVFALVILVLLLRPGGLFAWGRQTAVERM